MRVFRYHKGDDHRLGIELDGEHFDLSSVSTDFSSMATWLSTESPSKTAFEAAGYCKTSLGEDIKMVAPIDSQEVWASGVTYLRSKVARMDESEDGGDFYDKVYAASRPELFFKSTPSRVVGHSQPVRIRRDSTWNVPEPELTLVLSSSGKVVGYTIGNDMSSRSIEGENPLYLPQAKVYDGSCAIGPSILVAGDVNLPESIQMTIVRSKRTVFSGATSTRNIARPLEELADFLFREMSFPHGVFLMTGTGIVPPDDFTLSVGDVVRITIDQIGTLENTVE